MKYIENKTYDEIQVGDSAKLLRTLTEKDIELFAIMSGDINPAHVDAEYARSDHFHRIIAHGMWGGSLISTVLGTELPGPGTIYISQSFNFKGPIGIGDTVTVNVTAAGKDQTKNNVTFLCTVTNQKQEEVISGTAVVRAPLEKIRRPRIELPRVILR